jgi:hypothetical protein
MAWRIESGSTVPPESATTRVSEMIPARFHGDERPTHAVVFEVRGDDVIAALEHALECHVKRIGAIEREHEPFRPFAAEEAIEPVPRIVERVLGGQSHLVPGSARIGQRLPRELVERLIDRLGLGERSSCVVEVDHG